MPEPTKNDDWTNTLFVVAVLSAGGLAGAAWLGAQLAALLAGNDPLPAGIGDALLALTRLPSNLGDPKLAWPSEVRRQLPGPALYWASTVAVVLAAGALAFLIWRVVHGRNDALDRRERLGVSTQGRLATARDLRPLLIRRPQPGRFVVGRLGRRLIATESPTQRRGRRRASGRGAVALVGPTRSGKTTAAIGGILDWDGPAILCSVKSDLLAATRERRASLGSIQVFDPSGVTGHGDASWSPLREATTTTGAVQAARAIVEAAPRTTNVEQGEFWSQMAESLLAGLMCVAANTEGRTFADVVRWIVATDMPTDNAPGEVAPILRALRADGDPARKQAGEFGALVIEGLWRNDPRTVSSVYATARTIVWPWIDPLVAEATKACTVDLDWLLDGPNTLYICVPVKDQHRLRPVLGGLLNDLMHAECRPRRGDGQRDGGGLLAAPGAAREEAGDDHDDRRAAEPIRRDDVPEAEGVGELACSHGEKEQAERPPTHACGPRRARRLAHAEVPGASRSMSASSWRGGRTPATRPSSLPSGPNTTSVGMLWMPSSSAVLGLTSALHLPNATRPS